MKPLIVVSDGMDSNAFNNLKEELNFNVHDKSKLSQEELLELLPNIEGLVIRSATTVTADFLEKATKLKYVIRAGEGTDNIDKVSCCQKNVKVSNTPGANNNSAAEHALALMMTLLRKTAAADSSMKNGKWEKAKFVGNELTNKNIGIVGFGRIGQILAKRLQGFEPSIKFYDPFLNETDIPNCTKANSLDEIFETCEIISVHTPLNDHTKNLIGTNLLSKMSANSILINAARGGIVNETDLLEILKNKKIKAAALDVYSNEPLDENSEFRKLDNIVLTPHLGASTEEAQVRVGEMAVHQLKEFFLNENLLNEVKA